MPCACWCSRSMWITLWMVCFIFWSAPNQFDSCTWCSVYVPSNCNYCTALYGAVLYSVLFPSALFHSVLFHLITRGGTPSYSQEEEQYEVTGAPFFQVDAFCTCFSLWVQLSTCMYILFVHMWRRHWDLFFFFEEILQLFSSNDDNKHTDFLFLSPCVLSYWLTVWLTVNITG